MAFTKVTLTGVSETLKAGWTKFNSLIDDLLSTSSGKGASQIGIADSGSIITGVNVETALQENRTAINLNTAKVTNATHTGEVTGATALTIAANAVTNAKAAQMATKTYKGRTTAATGNAEDVPAATVRTDIGAAASGVNADITSMTGLDDDGIPYAKVYGAGNLYFPDYNEADQGLAGNGKSAKAYIDAIGADSATLYFRHNSGAATTTYTFSTDETIPSNINMIIEKGAILSIDSAKTLTINGPFDAGLYQVFSGDGSVVLANGIVPELYPEWWGATHEYADITITGAALQKAINVAQGRGQKVKLQGTYYSDVQLITNDHGLVLEGNQTYSTSITFKGCSGIKIDKVRNIKITDITIKAYVRHTTTPNVYIGLDIDGDTDNRPTNLIIRDVFFDGFQTAIEANWIWSSVFDNVVTGNGQSSIYIRGLSVNNSIVNCRLSSDGTAGSRGIVIGNSVNWLEGWHIADNLIYNNEIGILAYGALHIQLHHNIIDYCGVYGIYAQDAGVIPSTNWVIDGNYIGMGGTGGAGIYMAQGEEGSSGSTRGSKIIGNDILVYTGSTCNYGIRVGGAESKNNVVIGNSIKGMLLGDIYSASHPMIINGNQCLSLLQYNISSEGVISDNIGTVYPFNLTMYSTFGELKNVYGTTIGTAGSWTQGDKIWRPGVTALSHPGWVCIKSGTFGASTDNTGDTDGTTAVITGMTSTPFPVGSYVNVSAGFSSTGPYRVIDRSETSITINANSNAVASNITVDTSDPLFGAMADLQ